MSIPFIDFKTKHTVQVSVQGPRQKLSGEPGIHIAAHCPMRLNDLLTYKPSNGSVCAPNAHQIVNQILNFPLSPEFSVANQYKKKRELDRKNKYPAKYPLKPPSVRLY